MGFVVKRRVIEGDEKYIGYCRTVRPARWQPSLRRIGDLDRALELVECHEQPPVRLVEVVVAIFVWIGLLRREALSSLHALFSWIEVARRRRTVFWNSCRREITFMRASLLFAFADVGRQQCPLVFAQDAAVEGVIIRGRGARARGGKRGAFCLAMASPPQAEIAAALRGLALCGRVGYLPLELGGRYSAPTFDPSMAYHGRTRVPAQWLDGTLAWLRVLARRFAFPSISRRPRRAPFQRGYGSSVKRALYIARRYCCCQTIAPHPGWWREVGRVNST